MLAFLILIAALLANPSLKLEAQATAGPSAKACRCEPHRRPRFLLPVAGIGILPFSIASRDSELPSVTPPSLVDIRDRVPRNALEGERLLAVGALAPDTATALPTLMAVAGLVLLTGVLLLVPRPRRRRKAGWRLSRSASYGGWRLRTINRRAIGGLLAGVGGIMLLLGSREYAEGAQAQRRARAEWLAMGQTIVRADAGDFSAAPLAESPRSAPSEDRRATPPMSEATPSAVPLPLLAVSGREIRLGVPVARLVIPSIELDEIVLEGVGPVELNGGPGHFPGSVLPGDSGNSIISAHRDRHFRRVGELSVGSRIRTETRAGAVDWIVTERRIVSRDTPSLFEESEATLTLTTCWPLRYFGPAPDRLLILAKPA